MKKRVFTQIVLFLGCGIRLFAVDFPGWGADAVPDLYAPNLAGPGAFSTSTGGAPASAVNPAQGGEAQRIVFDIGYLGLAGMGDEAGYGNAIEAGMLFPTRYGVFGSSLRLIQSPFDESFPVEWAVSGNLNAAKEIYPRMSVGAGLNFGFGADWTVSGDLGFRWNTGKFGPLDNFTWAATLRSMGKSWTPSWFTPMGGVSFDLLRVEGKEDKRDPFVLNVAGDIGIPSIVYFPNTSLILKLGLKAEIAETFTVSLSWPGGSGLNARELHNGSEFPTMPSIGLGLNIALPSGGNRIAGGRLPSDGDLALDLAYKPLYKGVTALGAGLTWNVGIADKKPPVITIDYPETVDVSRPADTSYPADTSHPGYFSPNNDGKADYLEFPVSITDERYVASWVWEIRDEEGNIVRTYRNKELRPETSGVRNFVGRLTAVKTQVEVPPMFRWDGIGDSGELSPDGRYFFSITAADDSGNTGTIPAAGPGYRAILKNTPPEIVIEPMDDAQKVFSPGGGGSKNTITFIPEGSFEDAWESGIYNSSGDLIRRFETENGNPQPRIWDGRNNAGVIVNDSVYIYRIGATDRALNSASASLENIIVNTIRPVVSVIITDPWFNPNGEKKTVGMGLSVPVKNEVTGWTLFINDQQGYLRRTISGEADGSPAIVSVPDLYAYDGKTGAGAVLEEGEYFAEFSVHYLNGFTSSAVSPVFNLRTTAPAARVSSDFTAFSPNHGGVQSEMIIKQEGSPEEFWAGEIRQAGGEKTVRTFRFTGTPPAEIRWDGQGDTGAFAPDGEYTYELRSTDLAGNTGKSNTLRFRLSTIDTPVMITTDLRAFSPNGDNVRDSVNLTPHVQVKEGVASYKVDVLDSSGRTVRTFEGRGLPPPVINWNGGMGTNVSANVVANVVAPEGFYTARLELVYEQGNRPNAVSLPFELDITPPGGSVSVPYTLFSPNGRRAVLPFTVVTEFNDEWTAAITGPDGTSAAGAPVRTWSWRGAAPEILWDGKDNAGNPAPDGAYHFTMQSTDAAGNSARYNVPGITLDARVPSLILSSSATAIAPKPDQSTNLVRFGIICPLRDGIESWSLELKDESGRMLRRFNSPPPDANGQPAGPSAAPPPAIIGWNGLSEGGGIREGRFTPALTVSYIKGDIVSAESAPILVVTTGPQLSFSSRPQYFSPDNDGVDDELFISLGAKSPAPIASWFMEIREPEPPNLLFYRAEGRGSPSETIMWDGRSNRGELVQSATDYPVTYSATDTLGNTSTIEAKIGVDVLVIRDGDRLRIMIPSIVFRANYADFDGIPTDRLDNNFRVLRRIAEILNRFRDYKVQIEGHANPVLRTAAEERNELQPLSEARARMVLNQLVTFGVARSRLSSVGMGGTRPLVPFEDRDNTWKNRRVEFILIK